MENKDYLLQLTTEQPVRRKIKIDDQEYELAVPEDFELDEFLQLSAAGAKAAAFMGGKDAQYKAEDAKELSGLLDTVVKAAIRGLPNEVFSRLKTVQKFAIVNVFSDAVVKKAGGALPPEEKQPGQKSSQDSSDSTEDQSKTG